MCLESVIGMSLIYIRKNSGPRTDPCGTEKKILHGSLKDSPTLTLNLLSFKKSTKYLII